jgi:hypothetical protein
MTDRKMKRESFLSQRIRFAWSAANAQRTVRLRHQPRQRFFCPGMAAARDVILPAPGAICHQASPFHAQFINDIPRARGSTHGGHNGLPLLLIVNPAH